MTEINLKDKSKKKKKKSYYFSTTMLLSPQGMQVFSSILGIRTQLYLRKTSHGDFSLLKLPNSEPLLLFNDVRKSLLLTTAMTYITPR